MTRIHVDPHQSVCESLLAIERELVPESNETRRRVLERARAALPRTRYSPFVVESPTARGVRIGVVATGGMLLAALCFAAFYAGYETRSRSIPREITYSHSAVTVVTSALPRSTEIAGHAPVTTTTVAPSSSAVPPAQDTGRVTSRPALAPRARPEVELYAQELQVLQPARQAVAQRDFGLALGAIAEHQRKFPAGKLTEEREALRVKALIGLGRTAEAQRAGTAFRARFPRSALLGRIDEMLGAPK